MNVRTKAVELRTSRSTVETGAIQKGEDFVRAYAMGFDVEDAVAILRLDGVGPRLTMHFVLHLYGPH